VQRFVMRAESPFGAVGDMLTSFSTDGEANSTPTMRPCPRISRICLPMSGLDLRSWRAAKSSFELSNIHQHRRYDGWR
jgi:hypothetical protein